MSCHSSPLLILTLQYWIHAPNWYRALLLRSPWFRKEWTSVNVCRATQTTQQFWTLIWVVLLTPQCPISAMKISKEFLGVNDLMIEEEHAVEQVSGGIARPTANLATVSLRNQNEGCSASPVRPTCQQRFQRKMISTEICWKQWITVSRSSMNCGTPSLTWRMRRRTWKHQSAHLRTEITMSCRTKQIS